MFAPNVAKTKASETASKPRAASGPTWDQPTDHLNQEVDRTRVPVPARSWDFSKISVLAPDRPKQCEAPTIVHKMLGSTGQALDPSAASWFGSRFDHDFSKVRIHADDHASASARAVGASAFAVGQHIAFASGAYAPGTVEGDALLSHELAHVRQQHGSLPGPSLEIKPANSFAESEAEEAVIRIMGGGRSGTVQGAAYGLYRAPPGGTPPRDIPAGRRVIIPVGGRRCDN
jgi:hypothetical protein